MFGADPREHDFARELTRIRAELRETKLELNRLKQSVNSATNSVPTVISTKYTHPITTLLYGSEPQIRLQESSNQYTQYDVLGRLDYGSDPQQKQASIYVRRGATGGASDYPTDIILEIINDGGTAMVTIAEFLYSNRVNLNGLTTINAQNGDADLLVLQDRDTTVHTFEIDGDITTEAASSAGMQFIYNNTQNSGTAAFAEFIAAITPVTASTPLVTMGASITGYNGSYLGNYAWIHAQQRDLYLVANGVEADDQAIHFGTGAGSTAIASRGNVNASGLILSTGARLNEFSTDGTLAGDSDVAAPTEKAVKTYVDSHSHTTFAGNVDFNAGIDVIGLITQIYNTAMVGTTYTNALMRIDQTADFTAPTSGYQPIFNINIDSVLTEPASGTWGLYASYTRVLPTYVAGAGNITTHGQLIEMPSTYNNSADYGFKVQGDGRAVILASDNWAIHADIGESQFDENANFGAGIDVIGNSSFAGDLDPTTTKTRDLGDSTNAWNDLHIDDIYLYTTATSGGAGVDLEIHSGRIKPVSSSVRFKSNITPFVMDTSGLYDLELKEYDHDLDESEKDESKKEYYRTFGLIAEEVNQIFPQIVRQDAENSIYSYNSRGLIHLMLDQIQKLNLRVTELEAKIAELSK